MAHELALQANLASPTTSSGRASPVPRKASALRGDAVRDETSPKDKASRRYAAGVDRVLSLFDTAFGDWADYISFLGRLLKALQLHPPNANIVPSKHIVAKRLAQCLSPELPSGVHQKTLEVYSYIFTMIGTDALSRDLALYLPGLSTTLSFASLSIRKPFLSLLETHLIPIDAALLRPAMRSIVLMLLPGLEEDTSEDFERTLNLLDSFKTTMQSAKDENAGPHESTGEQFFWQCFFLASITSSTRRLGALMYMIRHLPRLAPIKSQQSEYNQEADCDQSANTITSPEPGLLLRCFAAGLGDEQILIQRGFLDLLVTHLPLHAGVLQNRVKPQDLDLLIIAAAGVVTRRDMSLNRRLWTWLLGPEPLSGQDTDAESPGYIASNPLNDPATTRTNYFERHGLQPLIRGLLRMINVAQASPAERVKPYRICLSLMDRWEIGGLVVPEVFLPIMSSVKLYTSQTTNEDTRKEVLRSVSVFFDGVESGLIWAELLGLLSEALGPHTLDPSLRIEKLELVRFIVQNFNVSEEEMLVVHAPITLLALLAMIQESGACHSAQENDSKDEPIDDRATLAVNVAGDLAALIPDRAFLNPRQSQKDVVDPDLHVPILIDNPQGLQKIRTFYVHDQGNIDVSKPPFAPEETGQLIMREAESILRSSMAKETSSADVTAKARLFVVLLEKLPKTNALHVSELLSSCTFAVSQKALPQFATFAAVNTIVVALFNSSKIGADEISNLVEPLVHAAWSYLTPSCPKFHVETVRALWQLQTILTPSNHEIEAALCGEIVNAPISSGPSLAESARRFAVLWTQSTIDGPTNTIRRSSQASLATLTTEAQASSWYEVMLCRPFFLLLDFLAIEKSQMFIAVKSWMQSVADVEVMFSLFVSKFVSFALVPSSPGRSPSSTTTEGDSRQCLYYLEKLSDVLKWSSPSTWETLSRATISPRLKSDAAQRIVSQGGNLSMQEFFVRFCICVVNTSDFAVDVPIHCLQLHRVALTVLHQILLSPFAATLSNMHIETELIELLQASLSSPDPFIQISLLDVSFAALRIANTADTDEPEIDQQQRRLTSHDSNSLSKASAKPEVPGAPMPPQYLLKCLTTAFSSSQSRPVLDAWVNFMAEILPFYSESIFRILIPLVESLCAEAATAFERLESMFKYSDTGSLAETDASLIALLNGIEQVLARGHERLLVSEPRSPTAKGLDQPPGFFGNMVSGVFSSDSPQTRTQAANHRLTVLLALQDATRISFRIWSWGGAASDVRKQDAGSAMSFSYTSLRMRNRARRLLERLFAAETLECLETLVAIWEESRDIDAARATAVFDLLHVLDGSRPKHTMPAIFAALYSRTNPSAIETSRTSTLTSDLQDTDLVVFLVEYTRTIEDDATDEIWSDCMTFLRDILTNPLPYRRILPSLLEFASILGEKVDNTNFGEQRKMRRELGDIFLRMLTAAFTTKPMSFPDLATAEKAPDVGDSSKEASIDIIYILARITADLTTVLVEPERVLAAANSISASIIGPAIKSKSFPESVERHTLELLYQVTRLPGMQKAWKKDIGDAFNDPRFFTINPVLMESNWMPLLRIWSLNDKERMPELLTRLTPPTTAGIVFGVGATSARLEADRKSQLNLRRIATLVLAAANDSFVSELKIFELKIVELLAATSTSSPSSNTRAEIFILIRVLCLKISPVHLAPLWPTIDAELQSAITSTIASDHSQSAETYSNYSLLQACKLLDLLLCIAPDDFQLHEWLYITDTIDSVYRPTAHSPTGLVDNLAEELGSAATLSATDMEYPAWHGTSTAEHSARRPLLGSGGIDCSGVNLERKDELVGKVLRPFFSQLSIFAFERVYDMGPVDWEFCRRGVLEDIFDERGIVKAL